MFEKFKPAPKIPTYHGDEIHTIKVPANEALVGDAICFLKTVFSGKVGTGSRPAGLELITGEIVHASYGPFLEKNHYTVQLSTGKKRVVTNNQLYFHDSIYRKKWLDEAVRAKLLAEKIANGHMD